ncbi:hypothetical protein ACTFIT_001230 [Dictyostelium discoideum]
MAPNHNKINNIDSNKKCTLHPNKDIVFFCLDCKLIPCCIQCTSSKGEHHDHKTDPLESTSNILSLMNNFKDDVHQKKLKKFMISFQSPIADNLFQIQSFIHPSIDEHSDISSKLKNIDSTTTTTTTTNATNDASQNNVGNSSSKNENENDGEDFIIDRDTIKIIKQYQQSLIVLNNNNNINNSNKLNEYDNQIIHFHNEIIDDIKNNLKSIYTLDNCRFKIEIDENNNKFFEWDNSKFHVYIEGDSFKFKTNEDIAFKNNCNILSKLKNQLPSRVMLLDGFNQILTPGILPVGVKSLYLGDIKQELIIGSIPNTVTSISLLDGFNQKLTPGILPNRLGSLYLEIGSIPNTVTNVDLLDGFNQKLTPGILPDGVEWLYLGDIKKELIIGSIPNTVMNVTLEDGFNQKLTPGILPDSVGSLDLGDIKQELIIGSIPNTVTNIFLLEGFNQKLTPDILPENAITTRE